MTNIFRTARGTLRPAVLALGAAGLMLAACKLDVTNPTLIDANQFNPAGDGPLISLSAQTQFYSAFQSVVRYGGLFAEEHLSGAARTEVADIGRRNFFSANQDINFGLFGPLSRAIAGNKNVVKALSAGASAASDINLARAEMNLAFSIELMAETFCQGTIADVSGAQTVAGPALTPVQLLDSSITHFTRAISIAGAATGAEATKIVSAAKIGLARTYLQKGDNANAATAAAAAIASVSSSFTFNVPTSDDAANRPLANQIYSTSIPTNLDVVSATYRALNDPRVPWKDPGPAAVAQDGVLHDYQQQKYLSYSSPVRIASFLEAQYVQAEAKLKTADPSFALALIAARRVAGGQPVFTGTLTSAILTELLSQSARDFWLEAKKLGDWRRNGAAEPYLSAPGSIYKGALTFGTLTSVPIPTEETNTNPIGACP
ncbi:MAG: hypothetical protein ABJD07_00360 [Gemmatimonadaceae bacterium]